MTRRSTFLFVLLLGSQIGVGSRAAAQNSLTPVSPRGQTVTPAFEGWYKNRDGTFVLSFGYFNRNSDEQVDVPVGEDNFIAPGPANQGQPTHFHPRRHWGVFGVTVPADFGDKKVAWTLRLRGQTVVISGSLNPDWQIDALEGEATADNSPPSLAFSEGGTYAQGPLGIATGPIAAKVGVPLVIPLWVKDDGKVEPVVRGPGSPVALRWFLHQGAGEVRFAPDSIKLTPTGGTASTSVTFSQPGDYLLRVRTNDSPVASAGHAQCCWTNGFVRVTVAP